MRDAETRYRQLCRDWDRIYMAARDRASHRVEKPAKAFADTPPPVTATDTGRNT